MLLFQYFRKIIGFQDGQDLEIKVIINLTTIMPNVKKTLNIKNKK
jgi:hypothetical protein